MPLSPPRLSPVRVRALALAGLLLAAGCDARVGGISTCSKLHDLPFGLHLHLRDASRLPALDFELRWNVHEPLPGTPGIVSIGGQEVDAERGPNSEVFPTGVHTWAAGLRPEQRRLFARVEYDRTDDCSGAPSELLALDLRPRMLWFAHDDRGSKLVVHTIEAGRSRAIDVPTDPRASVFVDGVNGRHGFLAYRHEAHWRLERVDYASGERTVLHDFTSLERPRLHVGPGGRNLVVATREEANWTLDLIVAFADEPIRLGTGVVDGGSRSLTEFSRDGRLLLWTARSDTREGVDFVVLALGPAGPVSSRRFGAGVAVRDFRISVDSRRLAWISTTAEGTRRSLGIADLDRARTIFFVPSPAVGRDFSSFEWSPSRLELLAVGDLRADAQEEAFFVRADGRLFFASGPPTKAVAIIAPAWSPDGDRFAWIEDHGSSRRLVATDTTGLVPIEIATDVRHFAWSSDGRELAWTERTDGVARLRRGLPDASVVNTVDSTPTYRDGAHSFAWHPLHARLSFVSDRTERGKFDVWLADENGAPRRITFESGLGRGTTVERLAWSRFFGIRIGD